MSVPHRTSSARFDNLIKADTAQSRVREAFEQIGIYIVRPEPDRYNHIDFEGIFGTYAPFGIQVKVYSNRRIDVSHLRYWLENDQLVIVVFWDQEKQAVLWGDPLRRVLRTPTWSGQWTLNFSIYDDLHILNSTTKPYFKRWLQARLDLQISLITQRRLLQSTMVFPIPLRAIAIADPTLLTYLPCHSEVVSLLRNCHRRLALEPADSSADHLVLDVLSGARLSLRSPDDAARRLIEKYRLPTESFPILAESYRSWAGRISAPEAGPARSVLWAFDKLVRMFQFKTFPDRIFPAGEDFSASVTYPLSHVVWSVGPHVVVNLCANVALQSTNEVDILNSLHLLGIAGFHTRDRDTVQYVGDELLNRQGDFAAETWTKIQRQLLAAQAQAGIGEAEARFLRGFSDSEVRQFEMDYNVPYFAKCRRAVAAIYRQKLDEGRPTDIFVTRIQKATFDAYQKSLKDYPED